MKLTSDPLDASLNNLDDLTSIVAGFGLELIGFRVHRKIYCVETNMGFKCLKKSKLGAADLRFIAEALTYLEKQGFENCPRLDRSSLGEPFVDFNSELYVMSDWYLSQELDFDDIIDLSQASRFLAEFHRCAAGFVPSSPNPDRTCWLSWPAKLEERIQQLKDFRRLASQEKEVSEFSRLFLRHFASFYRQANLSLEALLKSTYPEVAQESAKVGQFCHHDYSSRNILRTGDQRLILIDFDYCLLDLRIHDLINLLVRNLKHNEWQAELGKFILSEYHRVNKLLPAELEVMHVLLGWPQEYWQVGLQYYYEKLPWPKERFLKKLRHKIDYQQERQRFLGDFPASNGIHHWKPSLLS